MTDTVTLYRADDGWRWRYEASGRTLADSGQGYSRRLDAIKGACRVICSPGYQYVAIHLRKHGVCYFNRPGVNQPIKFVVEATR